MAINQALIQELVKRGLADRPGAAARLLQNGNVSINGQKARLDSTDVITENVPIVVDDTQAQASLTKILTCVSVKPKAKNEVAVFENGAVSLSFVTQPGTVKVGKKIEIAVKEIRP